MTRKVIAISHINWLIAEQVRKHEACIGIRPINVHWHGEDEQGCNWNVSIWKGEADCAEDCKACIEQTVQAFRTQYNITEPFSTATMRIEAQQSFSQSGFIANGLK